MVLPFAWILLNPIHNPTCPRGYRDEDCGFFSKRRILSDLVRRCCWRTRCLSDIKVLKGISCEDIEATDSTGAR